MPLAPCLETPRSATDTPHELTPLPVLAARVAEGDLDALAALYDRTSRLVYSVAHRIVRRPEDAEEVTIDVYMKAWRGGGYDIRRGSVEAWLVTISRGLSIDRLRARRARREDRTVSLAGYDTPSLAPTPLECVSARRTSERLRQALSTISRAERELVELAFFGGCTHQELAHRFDLPLGTVKTRIRQGLLKLRQMLPTTAAQS